jgi:kynurenine formamidase
MISVSAIGRSTLGLVLFGTLFVTPAPSQTREKGPWWPHPIWGPDDQVGATNWITSEKILEALSLAKTGEVYELGHPYERGMPLFGARSYTLYIPGSPTYNEPFGSNRLIGHDEFVCAEIGQVGTQFDGLGHIGTRLTMPDGSDRDVFYNGVTVEEMRSGYGLTKLGIEHVKPIITRGVLVDVAGYKGVGTLPESYEVTVEDVRGALARQGLSESDLRPGDAIFLYNENPPGIGLEVARWIVDRQASMVGSDSWTTEVVPNPDPELGFPVHQVLIPENGIHNLENMALDEIAEAGVYEFLLIAEAGVYEFLFVFTPLPLVGATGSPGRPLAIR